ncbi:hypothetical protein PPACK8108_LOCUS2479, partial [Phakopsora pachyrhizi]
FNAAARSTGSYLSPLVSMFGNFPRRSRLASILLPFAAFALTQAYHTVPAGYYPACARPLTAFGIFCVGRDSHQSLLPFAAFCPYAGIPQRCNTPLRCFHQHLPACFVP